MPTEGAGVVPYLKAKGEEVKEMKEVRIAISGCGGSYFYWILKCSEFPSFLSLNKCIHQGTLSSKNAAYRYL